MFIHIGSDVSVNLRDVIAIMDINLFSGSDGNTNLYRVPISQGGVADISDGNSKSLILTYDRIFISPISIQTLRKRTSLLLTKIALK